jgi:hypothetical protein
LKKRLDSRAYHRKQKYYFFKWGVLLWCLFMMKTNVRK